MTLPQIIGHTLGALGVCALISSYQLKKKSTIMLFQTIGSILFVFQFLFLGELSGLVLNGMCLVRNILFCLRDKMGKLGRAMPYICGGAIIIVGIFVWEGLPSLLLMVGLAINTVCLGICSPQKLRASLLLTCALVGIYDALVFAYAGVANEILSMISAAIGLVRYKNRSSAPMEDAND